MSLKTKRVSIVLAALIATLGVSGAAVAMSDSALRPAKAEATAKATAVSALPKHCNGKSKGLIGFANVFQDGDPFLFAIRDVVVGEAAKRCFQTLALDNHGEVPRAVKNADLMIGKRVKYAIEFQVVQSGDAVIAAKFAKAKIPVITFDVPWKGWYFVGAPNYKAGQIGGRQLGIYASKNWDCKADLVLIITAANAGDAGRQRNVGEVDGLLSKCPKIGDVLVHRDGGGGSGPEIQALTRDVLAARPSAKRILVTGVSGGSVIAAINAAEQLGRADQIYGWGQDGSATIGQKNVDSHLGGDVAYFLDGYGVYAFSVIDRLERGVKIPRPFDTPTGAGATLVKVCALTTAQAAAIPGPRERVKAILRAKRGTGMADLYCPKGSKR